MNLWATKSITTLRAEADEVGERSLKRSLGALNLTTLGIGAIIGAGIFVLTGQAAALHAGPAVPISMILVGIACAFAGLCYAEMAAAVPVAGSAYTYAYATMGELIAWIIGWDLVLEYAAGAAGVGVAWSGHLVSLLSSFGIMLPDGLTNAPTRWCTPIEVHNAVAGCVHSGLNLTGAVINLPAVFVIALMSAILVIGIKESARVNNLIVILKVAIVLLVVFVGVGHITPANLHPFIPANTGQWGTYGPSGVLRGAGLVFFAYIGFDAVTTAAQEARNPQRDLPIGILASLAICTVLYVAVAAVLVGMVPYTELNNNAPVAYALKQVGASRFIRVLVDFGAVCGLGSAILVMLLGQSRVFYSMSRDGLLGRWAAVVHPRFRTPYISTIFTGLAVGIATGVLPLQLLGQLVNIGTLLAFVLVCAGVLILRRTRPDLERPFRTPFVPFVPIMGILCCFGLMATLPGDTWIRLAVWLLIGLVIYLAYGRRHSVLAQEREKAAGAPATIPR
ncbi:MAG: amino acid permease [Gemmatimonadota bacterium]